MVRTTGLLLGLTLCFSNLLAQPMRFAEGVDYLRVDPAQPVDDPARIEVIEAFSYGCVHCYTADRHFELWKARQPQDVDFVRMHVTFGNPQWELYARGFYASEALGLLERTHVPLFESIYGASPIQYNDADKLAAFLAKHGGTAAEIKAAMGSMGVTARVRRADQVAVRTGVDGTPSVIINGKWRVKAQGTFDQMFEVIDYLIDLERKAMSEAKAG